LNAALSIIQVITIPPHLWRMTNETTRISYEEKGDEDDTDTNERRGMPSTDKDDPKGTKGPKRQ